MPLPPYLSYSSLYPLSNPSILSQVSPTMLVVFHVISAVYPLHSIQSLSHHACRLPRYIRCLPPPFYPKSLPPCLSSSTLYPLSTPSILSQVSPTMLVVFLIVLDVYPFYSVPCLSHHACRLPRCVRCLPLLLFPMPIPPYLSSSSLCPPSTPSTLSQWLILIQWLKHS